MAQEFKIEVCRTSYAFATITVTADSYDEAVEKALDEAGEHTYSEKDAEYSA